MELKDECYVQWHWSYRNLVERRRFTVAKLPMEMKDGGAFNWS